MQMDIDDFLAQNEFTPSNMHLANFLKQQFKDELADEQQRRRMDTPTGTQAAKSPPPPPSISAVTSHSTPSSQRLGRQLTPTTTELQLTVAGDTVERLERLASKRKLSREEVLRGRQDNHHIREDTLRCRKDKSSRPRSRPQRLFRGHKAIFHLSLHVCAKSPHGREDGFRGREDNHHVHGGNLRCCVYILHDQENFHHVRADSRRGCEQSSRRRRRFSPPRIRSSRPRRR